MRHFIELNCCLRQREAQIVLIFSSFASSYHSIEKDVVILRKISPGEKIHR